MLELFKTNNVSVAVVTEAEVPATTTFDINGYVSFYPLVDVGDKCRVVVARNARLATDLVVHGQQAVWVRLDAGRPRPGKRGPPPTPALLLCGVYRQWSQWRADGLERGLPLEKDNLHSFLDQTATAAVSKRVVILGDVNLDALQADDASYSRRSMLLELRTGLDRLGIKYQ
jgi:hypothetical protein